MTTQISIYKLYDLNYLLFLALFIMLRCLANNVLQMIWKKEFEAF